jgi:hypothetical protein
MAYEATTKAQSTDPIAYLDAVNDATLRHDAKELLSLFEGATKEPATMWGQSIIGFGKYDYTYASGHSGTSAKVGFAVRKTGLVIYLCPGFDKLKMELTTLGPHKTGKGCLYLKSLEGIDRATLAAMITQSVAEIDRLYPKT